jgi:hypothetical protein
MSQPPPRTSRPPQTDTRQQDAWDAAEDAARDALVPVIALPRRALDLTTDGTWDRRGEIAAVVHNAEALPRKIPNLQWFARHADPPKSTEN